MRKPVISNAVIEKFQALEAARQAYEAVVNTEVQKLKSKYLGKPVRVIGNPGWNRGRIWNITLSHMARDGKGEFNFYVGPNEKATRYFSHDQIELLDEEEAAEYEKTLALHEKINARAKQ